MPIISIRISDELLQSLDEHALQLMLSRAEYIRTAVDNMNKEKDNEERNERLKQASLRSRKQDQMGNDLLDINNDKET